MRGSNPVLASIIAKNIDELLLLVRELFKIQKLVLPMEQQIFSEEAKNQGGSCFLEETLLPMLGCASEAEIFSRLPKLSDWVEVESSKRLFSGSNSSFKPFKSTDSFCLASIRRLRRYSTVEAMEERSEVESELYKAKRRHSS